MGLEASYTENEILTNANVLIMRPECNFFQFEENAHGGASAIGQFVSSDSKGGGSFGGMGGGGGHGGGAGYGQVPVDSVTILFHVCVIRGLTIYTRG